MDNPDRPENIADKITDYKKKKSVIDSIVSKRDYAHNTAINKGLAKVDGDVGKIVEKDEEGNITKVHYDKIDDIVEEMKKTYLEHAKKEFGIDVDKEFDNEEEKKAYVDMVMNWYAGITVDQLRDLFRSSAEGDSLGNITPTGYSGHAKKHTGQIQGQMYGRAMGHFIEDDVDDLISHLEEGEKQEALKHLKPRHKTLENALHLLEKYNQEGAIGEEYIKNYDEVVAQRKKQREH